jgi:hypothetical protein
MSEHLQHDPKTKSQIKDILYGLLYAPVQQQFKQRLDAIIVHNTVVGGYTHKSFMYRNVLYSCDSTAAPRKMNRLMPAVMLDMADYLKDLKQLNEKEVPYVLGYINQVLNSTNNLSDYLRLLPEAVHGPLKAFIVTCPCHTQTLHADTVAMLQAKNEDSINLIKTRMVTNLII